MGLLVIDRSSRLGSNGSEPAILPLTRKLCQTYVLAASATPVPQNRVERIGAMNLDMSKLEPLLGTMVNELGAAANAALVLIGDKLGLFRALAERPVTSAELAAKTGTNERYVREWLAAQAASGFVTYDGKTGKFSLSPEQAAVFADEDSPVFMTGGFQSLAAVFADEPKLTDGLPDGAGPAAGASIATACSAASSASSARATRPTSSTSGCRRSTAWSRSCSAARRWPTSAAATAHRPS